MPGLLGGWKPLQLDKSGRLLGGSNSGLESGLAAEGQPTVTASPFLNTDTTHENALAAEMSRQSGLEGFDIGFNSLGGFVESAMSAVPELFGMDPNIRVEAYRAKNPALGFASEMLGIAGPYGAAYRLSKLPKMAAALETATARTLAPFGIEAGVSSPISTGAVKEILRYTPLELSRLGTGYAWYPENMDNLFADVALSTVFTGAFGGVGGFLRRAGTAKPESGRVVGADQGLLPTFELRIGMSDEAAVSGDIPKQQLLKELRDTALDMTPQVPRSFGKSNERYVYGIEGGTDGAMGALNSMFKADSNATLKRGLISRKLFEGPKANKATLDLGEQALVVEAAGFKSIDDLASTLVYPRLTEITAGRKAGQIARELSNAEGVMQAMDGTIIAKETDGLFMVMKPLSRGANKIKGAQIDVRNGDRWLIGKTDQIGRFMPEADKVFKTNMESWAKLADVYRPSGRTNVFDEAGDLAQSVMTPVDFEAIRKGGKKVAEGRLMGRIAQRLKDEAGIANSAQVKGISDKLYDWFAPTQFKEMKDSTFARLYGMWKVHAGTAEEWARKLRVGAMEFEDGAAKGLMLGQGIKTSGAFKGYEPYEKIVRSLSNADLQLVHKAAITQTPADDLAKLIASGDIGPGAVEAVEKLKNLNEDVLQKLVLPALEDAGMANDFHWLKNYILPRVQRGTFHVQVKNEKGALQWLATGRTGAEAQKEAKMIVAEAADQGQTWSMSDVEAFGLAKKDVNFADIQGLIYDKMALDAGGQDIAKRALRKMYAEQGLSHTGVLRIRKPSANVGFQKDRTGIGASVDLADITAEDFIGAMDSHYRQLLNLAAYATWHARWGDEALRFSKKNPVMYTDLVRKVGVGMGFEGQLTQYINKGLGKIPGFGPRSGTQIASKANEIMYAWNLGILNTSFAVLNALSPLQQVMPHVAYQLEAPNPKVAELMQFVPKIDGSGQVRGLMAAWDTTKIMQQSVRQLGKPDKELTEIQQRLVTDGALAPQVYDNFFGSDSPLVHTLRGAAEREGGWGFIKELSTMMATKSEQFGRLVAANSQYLVGKNHFGLEGEQLYRFVRRGVDVSMYGYGVADRARVMTGPLGSTFGLFKNWQFHFIGTMWKNASLAKNEKIFGPMLWQGATALAIGGLGGTPLKMLADGLSNQYTESPTAFQWLQENWNEPEFMGGRTSDAVYYGLPAFLGISLQSSATMPGTDIRNDLTSLSNVVLLERGKLIKDAAWEAMQYQMATGNNALKNSNIRDSLFNAFAPRAAIRAASVVEGEYVKSLKTGYAAVQDVSMASRILHATGFNAIEIERHQTAARELWKDQESQRGQIQQYGKAMAEAIAENDYEEMNRLQRTAMIKGLPLDSIYKSAGTRGEREQGSNYDRFDAAKVANMQRMLGE